MNQPVLHGSCHKGRCVISKSPFGKKNDGAIKSTTHNSTFSKKGKTNKQTKKQAN